MNNEDTSHRTWPDRELPRWLTIGVSAVLVAVIAAGDLVTGPYLVFATFYTVPVIATAWYAGRRPALVIGAAAAAAGAVSTAIDPGAVTAPVYLWNGVFRFVLYAVLAYFVDGEHQARRTVQELSQRDALTGLPNRRRFYDQAAGALERAGRSGAPLAFVYIDVDGLKARNDVHGHQAGDRLLTEFADVASRVLRGTDSISRLGGDEFCAVIEGADLAAAEAVVDRLAAALRETPSLPIEFSAGIVAGPVGRGQVAEVEEIVRRADALMYEAKSAGKAGHRGQAGLTGS